MADSPGIAVPNHKPVGTSTTSPLENDTRKVAPIPPPKMACIFWIGGAGDQRSFLGSGPNRNIEFALREFLKRIKTIPSLQAKVGGLLQYKVLGYYDVHGDDNIKKNVIAKLRSKDEFIYIVGHSLGGWNGAHLTKHLKDSGYNTTMLITLDPVGEDPTLEIAADIYMSEPKVKASYWINVRAEPPSFIPDASDVIAFLGEQWTIIGDKSFNPEAPDINRIVYVHHLDAEKILMAPIRDKDSALDYLVRSLSEKLNVIFQGIYSGLPKNLKG